MEVQSPGKSEAVTTGNTKKGPKYKVYWRCCVPGCKSNKSILRHAFPKDARLSNSWRDIIKNPDLQDLTTEELRKYRVCQLHFAEDKYTITSVRRVLRNDAIPELMLDLTSAGNGENTIDEVLHRNQDTREPSIDMDLQDKQNTAVPGWNVLPTVVEGQQHIQVADQNSNTDLDENNEMKKDNSTKGTENIQFSTPKTSKKRPLLGSVTRKGKLTPMARRLHGIASNLLKRQSKHLHKLHSYKQRIQSAEKFCGGVQMKEMQSLSKDQLAFIEMHIRNVHKKAKARRFTLDDKIMALAILKQSAQCYRLLSRIFILPTPRSLRTFLRRIPLKPGVNNVIMDHIKEEGKKMTEKERICILAWDEASIDSQIYYNEKEDKIIGFEDWGNARTNKFADHVLLFILRGVERNWMIPLTYNFCKSSTSANQLVRCIKEIVQAVTNSGFKIVATVCDQGATNVSSINTLLRETRRKCFSEKTQFIGKIQMYEQHIIPLYDPPHLIKGIRNNLLTKNIEVFFTNCTDRGRRNDELDEKMKTFLITPDFIEEINEKLKIVEDGKEEKLKNLKELQKENKYFASWDILELAYDIDTKVMHSIKKQMPKLNDGHIRKNKIRKMRVNLAAQVLSRSMAAFIRFLTNVKGSISTIEGPKSMPVKEGVTTSVVVQFFNDVFDSVNGGTHQPKKERNALRREVTQNSVHTFFWEEAVISMKNNIRFINPVTNIPKVVPSLRNWIVTLNGFQRLWQTLQQLGFNKFSPRHVNQDTIENFFGMIRSHGRRNINPTCMQFESSFKTLLINNLTSAKTIKGNCKDDNTEILSSLRNFALFAQKHGSSEGASTEAENKEINEENTYVLYHDAETNRSGTCIDNSRIFRKLVNNVKINTCCECTSSLKNIQNFDIFLKEAHSNLEGNIAFFCFKKDVVKNLSMPLQLLLDYSFITCTTHAKSFIEDLTSIIAVDYVFCWCTYMNKLLKGKDAGAFAQALLSKQAIHHYRQKLQKKNR